MSPFHVVFLVSMSCSTASLPSITGTMYSLSPFHAALLPVPIPCSMSHLDNSLSPLALPVEAKSLMPLCHFELEQSDYLSEQGGGHTLEASAEIANAKVLEFAPCALGQCTTRCVCVCVFGTMGAYHHI